MQNLKPYRTQRPIFAPEIACRPLPAFDPSDIENVRRAFQSVTPCLLRQAGPDEEKSGFSPATVRTGWRENSLLVFAELADQDIFNDATILNQRTWELGDVFEMFLGSSGEESYVEFHVTPGNQRLQLRYADGQAATRARETGRLEEFLLPGEAFRSWTWVATRMHQWSVYAEIPALAVCGSNKSVNNTRWQFSFSRYDYTRGVKEPCISSTSPHAKLDFHRRHEWGVLTFENSF
jgi:hypothetical protein